MSVESPSPAPTLTLLGGTRITKPLVREQLFVIGASRASDFRIPHPSIAPRHVVITWDGKETRTEDASGGTGFLVNGQAKTTVALRDGDVLRIGDFEFLFQSVAVKPKAARSAA